MAQPKLNEKAARAAAFETRAIDLETRTVELAFATEAPYERWYGYEILDCTVASVDLSRLIASGPLLMDHDPCDQVGVIESVRIDADRVCRAVVRFSQSARGQEIFQDVIDGIRKNVSVGYMVNAAVLVGMMDDIETYRITSWTPYEISLVSCPADIQAGVGRSNKACELKRDDALTSTDPMDPNGESETESEGEDCITVTSTTTVCIPTGGTMTEKTPQPVDVQAIENGVREAEKSRIAEIRTLGEKAAHLGGRDLALEMISAGRSVDDMKDALLERMPDMSKRAMGDAPATIGMSTQEIRKYSLVRLLNALAHPKDLRAQEAAAFELDCARAAADIAVRAPRGALVPFDVLGGKRDLTVGTNSAGGYTVATDLLAQDFIELLRNAMVLPSLGARMLTGLVGNIAIPRLSGASTAYWVSESSAPTESQQTFDQVTMSPKTVGAFTDISRKLLLQSSLDIEAMVRQDLATVLGLAIQQAAINGSGTAPTPRGILNTSGIGNASSAGADGAAPTWAQIVNLESLVAAANADVGTLAYLTNAKVRGKLKGTFTNATYGEQPVWGMDSMVNGYNAAVTNAVPSDLTKGSGTALSAIIFGNFADLLIGMWGGLDLTVDPYSNSTSGTLRIVALQDVDVAVRHAASFAAATDVVTS
jgi:HK97 family phage major capsid protein